MSITTGFVDMNLDVLIRAVRSLRGSEQVLLKTGRLEYQLKNAAVAMEGPDGTEHCDMDVKVVRVVEIAMKKGVKRLKAGGLALQGQGDMIFKIVLRTEKWNFVREEGVHSHWMFTRVSHVSMAQRGQVL